jgi:MFS family permease
MPSVRVEEWRRHWRVALGATIVAATGGSVWPYVMSGFIQPLQTAFGWSRGDLAIAMNASLLAALASPITGRLADRFGVRPILSAGCILMGLCFILLANNPGSLLYYFIVYACMSITSVATSSVAYARAITSWFDASRGLALSSTRIGITAVAAILPTFLFTTMAQYGWQAGYYVMAALTLLICLPAGWLFLQDRRDGIAPKSLAASLTGHADSGFAARLALFSNWRVFVLCFAIGAGYGAMIGILSQLQPMLVESGVERSSAAQVAGLVAVSTFIAALVFGYLLDRVWAPLVGLGATLAPVAGCFLLMSDHLTIEQASIAVILVGLASGAEIDLASYLTARYFGMKSFGLIYGLVGMVSAFFLAICGYGSARLYDMYGGYHESLIAAAILYTASALSYLLLGRYPKLETATDAPSGSAVLAE